MIATEKPYPHGTERLERKRGWSVQKACRNYIKRVSKEKGSASANFFGVIFPAATGARGTVYIHWKIPRANELVTPLRHMLKTIK